MRIQILKESIIIILYLITSYTNCKSAKEECNDEKRFYFNNCIINGIIQNNNQKLTIDPIELNCNLWIKRELNCNKKDPLIPDNLIL